ncbi:cell envelope integrity protein CreD [Paucibacter sp. R3-3]|uniref:Cell envelope integrity protein CreD n=1 Tax=Roseateles agri TaxID=3098619 RepID=A0ABU5DC12_9BURK|nr:cell envelope integrity protein CreD [Paucibacter sp. R3-3]MDY0743664.1 cell envelope integrity protein CreD [Paucibacter sp. R3-3]
MKLSNGGMIGKLAILVMVALLLCVVLARIGWLVDERQSSQHDAVMNVAQSQAGAQTLLGPLLLRHCTERWQETSGSGADRKVTQESKDFVLGQEPGQLSVAGALNQEPRYRGLFKVNGYAGALQFDAQWPSLEDLQPPAPEHAGGTVRCEAPALMLATSDARGLRLATLKVAGRLAAVKPGTTLAAYPRGLHAELPAGLSLTEPLQVQLKLELAGTERFALVPAATATQLDITSDWPHPSFGGRFLPTRREISEQGFTAHWQVSELASSAGADVLAAKPIEGLGGKGDGMVDTLDFSMVDPVNPYVMSDRAIKYGLLFIVLSFVTVGLVEVLAGRRVHPLQYLQVGLALSVFFLLLLSLSEHLSFALSYGLAAAAVALLLGHYGAAMLGGRRQGLAFGVGIAALYGALYTLLTLEQTALLIGALLFFLVLAAVMVLTRRIDWYALGRNALASGEEAGPASAP